MSAPNNLEIIIWLLKSETVYTCLVILFHHNARSHSSAQTTQNLNNPNIELMPYRPDTWRTNWVVNDFDRIRKLLKRSRTMLYKNHFHSDKNSYRLSSNACKIELISAENSLKILQKIFSGKFLPFPIYRKHPRCHIRIEFFLRNFSLFLLTIVTGILKKIFWEKCPTMHWLFHLNALKHRRHPAITRWILLELSETLPTS